MFYFEKILMGEDNKGQIHNIRLQDSDRAFLDMRPGDLAVIKGIASDDLLTSAFTRALGVPTTYLNYNGFDAEYPTAPLTDKVVICDPVVVTELTKGTNKYRIGNETYGNTLEAGRFGRARVAVLNEVFELGDENFDVAPTVGQYATAKANSGLHTPAVAVPVTGYCVKIEAEKTETTGAEAGFKAYVCRVVQL